MRIDLNLIMKKPFAVLAVMACFIISGPVRGQAPDSSKKYKVYLEPYLIAPALSGTVGVGNLPNTFICVPAGKLFSYFKIGGMLYAEVHNDRWAFTTDVFYASLEENASSKNGIIGGTATVKQLIWEVEGLRRLNPWLEAGIGARINSIQNGINIVKTGNALFTGEATNTWVDPLIVVRLSKWVENKWLFSLRADIGGFGLASQFAWQLQPNVYFRASRLLQIGLGYRALSTDYSHGSGSERFVYDMDEYGPVLRIGFNL